MAEAPISAHSFEFGAAWSTASRDARSFGLVLMVQQEIVRKLDKMYEEMDYLARLNDDRMDPIATAARDAYLVCMFKVAKLRNLVEAEGVEVKEPSSQEL